MDGRIAIEEWFKSLCRVRIKAYQELPRSSRRFGSIIVQEETNKCASTIYTLFKSNQNFAFNGPKWRFVKK